MKHIFKYLLFLLIGFLIYLNCSLYYKPQFVKIENEVVNKEVYHQLQFLNTALQNGAGKKMQQLFPEGFVFINALYGLSWYELISELPTDAAIYKEGITQIRFALNEINSSNGKRTFDENLPLSYGAFYKGWSNYLLGKLLEVQPQETQSKTEEDLFISNCKEIATALNNSNTPFLESYHKQAWPADMLLCIASLNIHDNIFANNYETEITKWLTAIKERVDINGLIPHKVDAETGYSIEDARGNSQSLILNFLFEIDADFTKQQFKKYDSLFKDGRFGLPGIRQYPSGIKGGGDIDSGPIIFGIGGAASIVGQRVYAQQNDWATYEGLRNSIESFGFGLTINKKKRYIFGQLPMADAFICWSNAIEKTSDQVKVTTNWRIMFHLYSAFVLAVLFLIFKLLKTKPVS